MKYFPNGDFLEGMAPKNASTMWKSIVHGRDMLKEGLIW
jgi:hypothetical protein